MVQFSQLMGHNTAHSLIHANAVSFQGAGILLLGNSGSGKSDLSLRLIDQGGVLISDDYTSLSFQASTLCASPPENIAGKLEVRGIGIIDLPYKHNHPLHLVIMLCKNYERLPEPDYFIFQEHQLPKFTLNPFEISVINKIKLLINMYL